MHRAKNGMCILCESDLRIGFYASLSVEAIECARVQIFLPYDWCVGVGAGACVFFACVCFVRIEVDFLRHFFMAFCVCVCAV